jgi:hypothetical protein
MGCCGPNWQGSTSIAPPTGQIKTPHFASRLSGGISDKRFGVSFTLTSLKRTKRRRKKKKKHKNGWR